MKRRSIEMPGAAHAGDPSEQSGAAMARINAGCLTNRFAIACVLRYGRIRLVLSHNANYKTHNARVMPGPGVPFQEFGGNRRCRPAGPVRTAAFAFQQHEY
jgi:hypothetical protein